MPSTFLDFLKPFAIHPDALPAFLSGPRAFLTAGKPQFNLWYTSLRVLDVIEEIGMITSNMNHKLKLLKYLFIINCVLFSTYNKVVAQDTTFIQDSILIFASYTDQHMHRDLDQGCKLSLLKFDDSKTVLYETTYCSGVWANEEIPNYLTEYPLRAIAVDSVYSDSSMIFFQFNQRWLKQHNKQVYIDSTYFVTPLTIDSNAYDKYNGYSWYYENGVKVDSVLTDSDGFNVYVVSNCDSSMFDINPHYMYQVLWFSERYGILRYISIGNGFDYYDIVLESLIEYRLGQHETYYLDKTSPMEPYIKRLIRVD